MKVFNNLVYFEHVRIRFVLCSANLDIRIGKKESGLVETPRQAETFGDLCANATIFPTTARTPPKREEPPRLAWRGRESRTVPRQPPPWLSQGTSR